MTGTCGLLLSFAASGAILLFLALAGAAATVPLWRGRAHLAVAYGLLCVGVTGTGCFFAFLVSPQLGAFAARTVLASAVGLCGWWIWRERRVVRPALRRLAAPGLLLGGTALGTVGLFALWHVGFPWFDLARTRFFGPLPSDNQIPEMLASAVWSHGDIRHSVGGDWHSSDRPPLQSGLLLLVQAATHRLGTSPGTVMFTAGVTAQFAWLPATYAVLRSIRLPQRATLVALLFAAASGTVLVNTVFTWPKLLSAAFVLAAVAVLLELPRERTAPLPIAGAAVLVVLGALSHGAAVFAVPVIGYAVLRRRRALSLRACAVAAGSAILVYLPWAAYQRWYDPPGDRLLKWHLAGVIPVTTTPFSTLLVHAYTAVPLRTLIHDKVSNVTALFVRAPWTGVAAAFAGDPSVRRTTEFFVVAGTLGFAVIPMGILAVGTVRVMLRSGVRAALRDESVRLVIGTAGCLAFWCLVMYGPSTTTIHQGSHVPLLLLMAVPVAWCAARRPRLTALLIPVQFALLGVTYGPPGAGEGAISPLAVGVLVLGGLASVAALLLATQPRKAVAAEDEGPGPGLGADDDTSPVTLRPLPSLGRRTPEIRCAS